VTKRSRKQAVSPPIGASQRSLNESPARAVRTREQAERSLASFASLRMSTDRGSPDAAWTLVFACWLVATVATLGALFFSEVMQLPPCALCWYQRIFIFPLVLLLPMGLFPWDRRVIRYALPLLLVGTLFSLFQLLLVWEVIPESIQPCRQGVSCKDVQIEWLGFLSIPLLSFVAFLVMNALLIAAHFRSSR
jgi:disulfide bond formation protein DsbB